jgi:hypothetical protein
MAYNFTTSVLPDKRTTEIVVYDTSFIASWHSWLLVDFQLFHAVHQHQVAIDFVATF